MTSTLEMNSTLAKNLEILSQRFPSLAERLASALLPSIQKASAQDGGYFYAHKGSDEKWHAISNPVDPIAKAQAAIKSIEDRIGKGFAPAVVVGLNPGYTLDIVFKHFKENYYDKYINRRIYVILDSTPCFYGWLLAEDRSEILSKEEVEFYWHTEARRIVRLCKRDEMRSHLFIPVSTLPEATTLAILDPLAQLFIERQEEEKRLLEENSKYYEQQSDKELDKIIQGKADRKPRMLIPSHASSTVVQYSVRDTAAMFEKEGWEVRIMNMQTDLSCWRINKNINDFKPDIYLLVNHLRTEDTDYYPPDMMFVTWVQDTVSYINNSENAKIWNEHVKSKKKRRDLIIGYVGQVKEYGYLEERLSECPMIVNQELFKQREITPEEKAKYDCDICFASNRSKETSLIIKEDLSPKLEKYGFTEDLLMSIHDYLWDYYRDENTCVGYIQLEDKIIEIPEVCTLIEKLINKDDHDYVIQRIYWELNDVIYRHVVLEWIDEMGDKKLHLYGRGWEDHPKFSTYAKGILKHGEELSLAYQCAQHCLHLNSLEGEHQRLSEIIDAKGNPLTRLSLDEETLEKQKQILEGCQNFQSPNMPFLNTLCHISENVLQKFSKSKFHEKLNGMLLTHLDNLKLKHKHESISFLGKKYLWKLDLIKKHEENLSKHKTVIYRSLIFSFVNKTKEKSETLIPFEISSFILKLFEGNIKINLSKYPVLQNNILIKVIQLSHEDKKEALYKSFSTFISADCLLPDLLQFYISWEFNFNNSKNFIPEINKICQRNPELFNKSDIYCRAIINTAEENKINIIQELSSQITLQELSPNLMSNYVNWHLESSDDKDVEVLIEEAYKKTDDIYDLNFKLAAKKCNVDNNWFQKAKKDLVSGRMSIQAAGRLATLSVQWAEESVVINEIFKYASSLQNQDKASSIHLVPIFSQCVKILGKNKLNKLIRKLSNQINLDVISKSTHAALLEIDLKTSRKYPESLDECDLYTLILESRIIKRIEFYEKDYCHDGLLEFINSAFHRKVGNACLKIFHFLNDQNYPLCQAHVVFFIKNSTPESALDFIKKAYLSNNKLLDLYSNFASEYVTDPITKLKYSLMDLKYGNLDIKRINSSIYTALNYNLTKKTLSTVYANPMNLHNLANAESMDLIPVFSSIIQFLGLKKFKSFTIALNQHIPEKVLNISMQIALLENNIEFSEYSYENEKPTPPELYRSLLLGNAVNIKELKNNEKAIEYLTSMGLSAQRRNVPKAAVLLYRLVTELGTALKQHQIYYVLSNLPYIPDKQITSFLSKAYQNNPNLHDIFYIYTNKKGDDEPEILFQDLIKGKMSIKSAGIITTNLMKTQSFSDAQKIIKKYYKNLILPETAELSKILSVWSFISQPGKPNKKISDFLKEHLPKDKVSLCERIIKIENSTQIDNQLIKEIIDYYNKDCESLSDLAQNFYNRKKETPALMIFDYLYHKRSLPVNKYLTYVTLLRDRSLEKALSVFQSIEKKLWERKDYIEYQFTRLLSKKTVSTDFGKTKKSNSTNMLYNTYLKLTESILLSESGKLCLAVKNIPDELSNNVQKLLASIIYLRNKNLSEAKKLLEEVLGKASNNLLMEKENISKVLIKEIAQYRQFPDKVILKDFILFRLLSPHSPMSNFKNLTALY